jgi:branched-chain amino acid transport system substrate-binding protein
MGVGSRVAAQAAVAAVVMVLLAAACSSDDPSGGAAGDDAPAGPAVADATGDDVSAGAGQDTGASEATPADGADAEADPGADIAAMEAEWAEARAQVVSRIRTSGYGVDADNVLTGPAGFEIDLDDCPSDWVDEPPEGEPIVMAQIAPMTGNLFAYGFITEGMQIYIDHVNATGGIDGRQIELAVYDDGYVRERTEELVDELLEDDQPFLVTTLGSPNSIEVYDTLNESCVPNPFVIAQHPAFGDPDDHPWTTGLQLSYTTEALIWGNWIKRELRDRLPVTVSALVIDNEFGQIYEDAFGAWAEANPDVVSDFVAIRHDPSVESVVVEMAELAATEPDVFISMTSGGACLRAVLEVGRSGLDDSAMAMFTPSVCKEKALYMEPAGSGADGFLVVGGGGKATTDESIADEPFIRWANERLADAGVDTQVGLFGTGFGYYAWAHVEAMRIAAELDGGLTRANLILAIRSLDLNHPMLLDDVSFAFDGGRDPFAVEGSEISRYDAIAGLWRQEPGVIDLNGASPPCSWTGTRCR